MCVYDRVYVYALYVADELLNTAVYVHISMYIWICMYTCVYIYINMYVYIYVLVWTFVSLFLVTNSYLELPHLLNLHLNIGSWNPESPRRGPEVHRNPQKRFLV